MISLLFAASPLGGDSNVWLPAGVVSAIAVALVTGAYATLNAISTKKLRSPADRLAEVEFYVNLAKQQVAEAREDKKELEATLREIRGYVETLETAGRADASAAREADRQLAVLQRRIDSLERRIERKQRLAEALQDVIDRVAQKVVDGEPITLADLEPIGVRSSALLDTAEVPQVA